MTLDMGKKKEEFLEAYRSRFACKKFDTTKKVSREDMDFILEAGKLTPSSFGFEPWKFLVIDNKELKDKVFDTAPRIATAMKTADKVVVILAKNSSELRYSSGYVNYMIKDVQKLNDSQAKAVKEGFRKFQERESSSVYDTMSIYHWSWRQSYLPLATMITAASQIGIATCPIEEYNEKQIERLLEDAGVLNRNEYSVSVLLAVGYADPSIIKEGHTKNYRDDVIQWIE